MEADGEFLYGDGKDVEGSLTAPQVEGSFGKGSFEKLMHLRDGMDDMKEAMRNKETECNGYRWKQMDDEVEVVVPQLTRKGISVNCKPGSLEVTANSTQLLLGKLYSKVISEDMIWCLVDGDLVITLEKQTKGVAWPSLFRE